MKKWYKSKTIIVNIIALILGLIPIIDVNFLMAFGVENVNKYLIIIGAITTFLNLILRMITTTTISSRKRVRALNKDGDIGGGNVPPIKDEK